MILLIFRAIVVLAAISMFDSPASAQTRATQQDQFWEQLQKLCGKAFPGRAVEAPQGNTTYIDKTLVMHVRACDANTIRIPFHVGEDRSRTWVISRTERGLRLKHDHRHEDGSEAANTQYGGDTTGAGTAERQDFPSDRPPAVPGESVTIWTVELLPGRTYVYALRRDGTDRRFRIEFDLSRTVAAPPPPWGG